MFSFPIYIPVQLLHLFTFFHSILFYSVFALLPFLPFLLLMLMLFCYCSNTNAVHWNTNLMQCFKLDKMIKVKMHTFLCSSFFSGLHIHKMIVWCWLHFDTYLTVEELANIWWKRKQQTMEKMECFFSLSISISPCSVFMLNEKSLSLFDCRITFRRRNGANDMQTIKSFIWLS